MRERTQTQDNHPIWYEPPDTPSILIDHEVQARLDEYMVKEDAKVFPIKRLQASGRRSKR